MTMVLCLCFLICHPTFLLVAVFEKIVGTCSSTIYLRAFITITESALLTEEMGMGLGYTELKYTQILGFIQFEWGAVA